MQTFAENLLSLFRTKKLNDMAKFLYEATVASVVSNRGTYLRAGTVWMNIGNVTSLKYYDGTSTYAYLQTKDGGLRLQRPTQLLLTGTQTTIATALEAGASSDNEFRTLSVKNVTGSNINAEYETMTLAVKDIAYILNHPTIDGVQVIRYISGGTKPLWLLVVMSDEAVPEVFDSDYTGSGTGGTVFDEDEESW